MSEDFLTRWSRRKRDAEETEQAKSTQAKAAPGATDPIAVAPIRESVTPIGPVEGSEAARKERAFDLKCLPPTESTTAAPDTRPFLARGVPADIARAALRRAWSADPRIR